MSLYNTSTECAINEDAYKQIEEKIKQLLAENYSRQDLQAEVHNLWQEYIISEEQELKLYILIDADEDSPAEDWDAGHGCVELWEFVETLDLSKEEEEEEN